MLGVTVGLVDRWSPPRRRLTFTIARHCRGHPSGLRHSWGRRRVGRLDACYASVTSKLVERGAVESLPIQMSKVEASVAQSLEPAFQ
jgi:hypothetical protein